MASVMQATSSAYKSGMLWWRYGGLNLVGIGIFTRGVVFVGLTNTPPGDGGQDPPPPPFPLQKKFFLVNKSTKYSQLSG